MSIKKSVKRGVVTIAKKVVELEVNSTCPLIAYQPQIPKSAKRLKRKL